VVVDPVELAEDDPRAKLVTEPLGWYLHGFEESAD
jgi:hypothetical protein